MFLGVDVGTSGVKVVAIGEAGHVVAQESVPLSTSRPHPLWSEQDPDDWWRAVDHAVRAIDPNVRRAMRGIGLAGQMHGATVLGADDRPLRPAILWNDGRSAVECAELAAAVPALHEIAGNQAMPGFTAPKLLWMRRHEPELFAQVHTVLLPKDYVRLAMTGERASDPSDSAGTLWLDVARRRWSEAVLAACDLTTSHMPRLLEGTEISGVLRPEVARGWGMDPVPVAAGGSDNAAGAVAAGAIGDGDGLLSLGTSGVVFVTTRDFRPAPASAVHAFCHCLPDMWHQMSVHLSAASCVDWAARITGASGPGELFSRAQAAGPASGPELFLPYLSGERTPHNDPEVRGAFLRLDHHSDAARLAQAVLEGVAFALADGVDALRRAGTPIERLSVVGGGARSLYWGRIIAAALDVRLAYLEDGEVGPAIGAARLARLAVDRDPTESVCRPPPVSHLVEPEPALMEALAPKHAQFRAAYPRIAGL